MILINWLIKLQIWQFEEWDMNIIAEKLWWEYKTYKSFYDITTIPLMYHLHYLNISKKHLNIVAEWIDWYYSKKWVMNSEEWAKKWRELHIDLDSYNYTNSFSDDDQLDKKWMEIYSIFSKKSSKILEEEGIEVNDYWDSSSIAFHLWHLTTFTNDYINIEVSDLNLWYKDYQKSTSWYIDEDYIP